MKEGGKNLGLSYLTYSFLRALCDGLQVRCAGSGRYIVIFADNINRFRCFQDEAVLVEQCGEDKCRRHSCEA